jgi:hypothetical protein
MSKVTLFPFEVTPRVLVDNLDRFVDAVFSSLESEFLVLPKGEGFVEFGQFEEAYEAVKRHTGAFDQVSIETLLGAVAEYPLSMVIIRSMLGFTPSEWAYLATERTGTIVSQAFARGLDRKVRLHPTRPLIGSGRTTQDRLLALITTACSLLDEGAEHVSESQVHRLNKADSQSGLTSIRSAAVDYVLNLTHLYA